MLSRLVQAKWFLLGGFLFIAIVVVVAAIRWHQLRIPQVPFDSRVWQTDQSLVHDSQSHPTLRQEMVADLIIRVLPGMDREGIEKILGKSPTLPSMQRENSGECVHENEFAHEKYLLALYKKFGWDLLYEIGPERIFIWDHEGVEFSPDPEHLVIRLDSAGRFESWYIIGSRRWPGIVGAEAAHTYRARRVKEPSRGR